jgi:tetratricopeptide (TPR) repeat protein
MLRRAAPALVAAAAAVVYAGALRNGFVWDDGPLIATAPDRPLSAVLFGRDEVGSYYRPLNRASYLLDAALFGRTPAGSHAVNVLLHAAACVLLYALALRLFERRVAPALVAALLFAVHPLCSEPVLFVTARNNLFATVFVLAALLLACRGHDVLSAAAFLLGLLSKEPAAVALPLLLYLHRTPRRMVPHAVACAAYAGLRLASLGSAGVSVGPGAGDRLLAALSYVPGYLSLALWPSRLTIFHEPPRFGPLAVTAAWAAIVAASIAIARWRNPAARFGLLWFALGLLPAMNLVPIPSAPFAERYFYVPAVGLCLIAAAVWELLPPRAGLPLACAALVALAGRTVVRTRDWRDDLTLFASAIRADPRSATAHRNLGVALKDRGDLAGARREWEEALALDGSDAESLAQLGTLAAVQGDLAGAERLYRSALAAAEIPLAHFNLAKICERTGRAAEAIAEYEAFIRTADPAYGGDALIPAARERIHALTPGRP